MPGRLPRRRPASPATAWAPPGGDPAVITSGHQRKAPFGNDGDEGGTLKKGKRRPQATTGTPRGTSRAGQAQGLPQRITSTGTLLRASTSAVWLPSSTRVMPRRPCEVITSRSLPQASAVSMMPSAA